MQLSVFSPVFTGMTLEEALKYLKEKGIGALELACGGYSGKVFADPNELIKNPTKFKALKDLFEKYEIKISALSVHGNGVHPVKDIARADTADFTAACELGEKLGVDKIITFSGCPGDGKGDTPNWVTCAWPNEYGELLKRQWEEVLIPYWKEQATVADNHNMKICFELHPGFCVYNPETLLKLRTAVGKTIGANLDPSHLFWQGIDLYSAIKYLGDSIYFFHAKDTYIDRGNTAVNGVLDTKPYSDKENRSWTFRTVGYGHSYGEWKEIISALRLVGYDGAISIEHEDGLMAPMEGLGKAISFLQQIVIEKSVNTEMWWVRKEL